MISSKSPIPMPMSWPRFWLSTSKGDLVDLRYVRKELIFEHVDLSGKTVLFLYSTTILNTDPQILN